MFQHLGNQVSRFWPPIIAGWMIILAILTTTAPNLRDVVQDGEFAFLPEDSKSRRGEQLFHEAFPDDLLASSIVIVARRVSRDGGLITREENPEHNDFDFIDNGREADDDKVALDELKEYLEEIAREAGGLAKSNSGSDADSSSTDSLGSTDPPIIAQIRTYQNRPIGHLLISDDNQATLVIMELTTEFLDGRNATIIQKVENLLLHNKEFQTKIPRGLDLSISGSATVGRDMMWAAKDSAHATHSWTFALVVLLLILIYRAPVLAAIPLLTVLVSGIISLSTLSWLAQMGWVELFAGIDVYVTVVSYGAGVDYCLFLIARYNEELDDGSSFSEAIANSLGRVGAALTASAGTVMCGIGMMCFAQFGKFQQAGVAITLSLFVVLLASLTLTPSLLRLTGSWAFWPQMRTERIAGAAGWVSPTSLMHRLLDRNLFENAWGKLGQSLEAKPGTIWLATIGVMAPFAVFGAVYYGTLFGVVDYNFLTYGLLSELPRNAPSVIGTQAVQEHFPAGATGPVTVLIRDPQTDFNQPKGAHAINELTSRLTARKDELRLANIRSLSHPLGGTDLNLNVIERAIRRKLARSYYVSKNGDLTGHVTRIDLVFEDDPFSRDSIKYLERAEQAVEQELAALTHEGTLNGRSWNLLFIGPTASIRDLKTVTDADQFSINLLVLAGVLAILLILLRKPAICVYLIVSVFFSYLVTLGVTFALFWALDPQGFVGLDWKVPMFLFTILIAVGEDYNIFLMTRVEEEQQSHGPVQGVTVALLKTGSIISSCGFIMAGTFASLLAGSLTGMIQLGFALAFGVLLDTFVVRPILVPAYLILLYSGRFGTFGKFLGAQEYFGSKVGARPHVKVGEDV